MTQQWWFWGWETTADRHQPQAMYPLIASLLKENGVQATRPLTPAVSAADNHVWALGPVTGNNLVDVGLESSFQSLAGRTT